jgi:preprotein translocase subunit SecD
MTLLSRSPEWLTKLNARPMYLGLDLRGGVHFMMQVDMAAALDKRIDTHVEDLRSLLRDRKVQHAGVVRAGQQIEVRAASAEVREQVVRTVRDQVPDLQPVAGAGGTDRAVFEFKPESLRQMQDQALKQNITTLHNRINELGVAEPVIQQQGLDRIVVQLPGMQDPAQAKRIIGRTATLEMRLVDESAEGHAAEMGNGPVPFGSEAFFDRDGRRVILKKQVLLTGENLTDAQAGIDSRNQQPKVDLTVDAKGGQVMKETSRRNLNKRMAIVLFEKGKGEVVTAPVIRSEIGGGRVQISGRMTTMEANDTALLLRAGSLAAPMEIIEEYTIGPSLGADNIERGIHSVVWGMAAIAAFMCVYYMLFGVFSTVALGVNVLLLIAILSMLQATLTLPGIAAMALALGVAIDSNVLINERIREELRGGASPQAAIAAGYERAWATILDSNVTTLIAGLALLAFGSGPVRGFAVVHCIGILTSMFSAVFFSRGLVNLWYGRKKKLKSVSIGQVWKPEDASEMRSVAGKAQ